MSKTDAKVVSVREFVSGKQPSSEVVVEPKVTAKKKPAKSSTK